MIGISRTMIAFYRIFDSPDMRKKNDDLFGNIQTHII